MKNFTKQNFKTNPLWIRLLIMAFMLLLGSSSAWGKTFYLNPKWGNETWDKDGAWFEAWVWGDNVNGSWAKATKGSVYYEITVNDNATKVIWLRKSNTQSSGNWDCLNRTSDVDLGNTKNLTNITGWTNNEYCNFTTDTYNPCKTTTLTWNNESSIKTSMKKEETQTVSVTLSPSGAGTPTFTTSKSSVISLSGSGSSCTLTAKAAGSATITASFAEANGYCGSSIEKTITVTDPCAPRYYIAGTLPGASWDANNHLEMTCVDGLRSYTFTDAGKGEYKFKITNNTWGSSWNALNTSKSSGVTCKNNDKDGNMVFETPAEGNITIYFDDALKAWVTWEANCSTPKTPSIESSHSSICSGDDTEVTITVTGDADTYVLYVVNNGYTKQSNEAVNNKFTVSPTKTTTYVVKAFNGTCASDNYSNEITVEVSTKPNINLTEESKTICKGDKLVLSDFATSSVNLTWWNGETQITEPVSPEENTTYTVKAVNGACTVTKNFPVTVNALPFAPGLENRASSQCVTANGTVNLNTLASPVGTVNWYDSSSQLISNATVSIATAGIFTYTAKAVSNGCESLEGTSFTLTVKEQLDKPTLSVTNIIKCGNTHTDGKIVIENYNNANTYVLKKDSKPIEKIYKEGYLITKDEIGSYTVEVSKDGACGATSDAKTIVITDNTPTVNDFNISVSATVCEGNPFTMSYDGTAQSGEISYAWYEGAINEVLGRESSFEVAQAKNTTYKLKITVTSNDCSAYKESTITIEPKQRPNAPTFDSKEMSVCVNEQFTLPVPTNLQDGEDGLWTVAGQPTTQGQTLTEAGTYTYTAYINNGCPSDGTDFTVHVNPLPTITLIADNETANVGETVTLSVSGSDFTELKWSATDGTKSYTVTPGENNTATITTDENALITVTVVAKSDAGCETSASIDLTFGSEDCVNANADYIEILCRRTNNPESATAYRDMHCYAWDPNTNKTYLGGWPGVKTDDGDFEYKGKKYAVWQIKTNSDIYIIFSNGNDSQKTGDIKGANDAGLKKGYRYVYTLSSDYKTATLYEEPSIIFAPEVKTLSATCARQSDNSLKVTVTGKIMKKGCAEISSYGFQYKKDGDDYTNVDVCSSDCYQDAGFIFTKDITLAAGKYGEYTFRARLINKNSSKVYGEKITIYYSESDVLIAAVGDDTEVTNKSGVYYDFVGLYVKNVMLPEGAKVKSYKWYKGDAVYNSGNVTVADRGVSAANNNIRPSEEGAYKCVVTLDNNQTLTSNVINVTSTNTYSDKVNASNRNLPVISVRTNVAFPTCVTAGTEGKYPSTNIEGWKEKRSVDVKIFNANGTLYYDRKARMNYRGSSSLNFNKKSYAFCPGEENCGQEKDKTPDYVTTTKMNLFGLSDGAKDKDWVLYAAAADPTLMRNRIVFDTYADMTGKWGVDSKYVELVIDGVYQGVYVLMDKITNNEKRVDITDPNGFIVKFDKTDIADREADLLDAGQEVGDEKTFQTKRTGRVGIQTYNTFVDQLFEIEYPEKKKVVKNGGDWSTTLSAIKQKFEEFETALADGDYIKVRSLIDYESWADWFIINEFTKNVDAYRASCVFVYNGNKIEAQPLWDQELSFNNAAGANIGKKGADKTTGLLIENNGVYTDCFPAPFWFTGRTSNFNTCGTDGGESTEGSKIENYLLKDECFVATIKERWKEHTKEDGALHKKQLTDKLALLVKELGAAKDREIAKWPSDHRVADACGGPGTGYNDVEFTTSYTALENWIKGDLTSVNAENASYNRVTNLNYLINKMKGEPLLFDLTVNPINGVTTPWIPVTITVEAPEGYEYTYDDSAIKAEKGVIIKHVGDKYSYTFPRPEAWPTGNVDIPIAPKFYEVEVKLNVSAVDNSCGGTFKTDKKTTITLQDEGNDLCTYVEP